MYYSFFVKNQIRHHRFLFLAGAVQIAAAFLLILMLFSEFAGFFSDSRMFAKLNSDNYLFVNATASRIFQNFKKHEIYSERYSEIMSDLMEKNPDMSQIEAADKTREQIGEDPTSDNDIDISVVSQTPYYDDICMIYFSDFYTEVGVCIRGLSREFANNLTPDMRSGKWFSKTDTKDKNIDIVIFKNTNHSVGEIIPILYSGYNYEKQTGEWIDTGYSARVIGICEYDQNCPQFSQSSSSFDSLTLYELTENYGEENICVAVNDDLGPLIEEYGCIEPEYQEYMGAIIKLNSDLTAEQLEEAKQFLTQKRYSADSMTIFYGNTIDIERNAASDLAVPAAVGCCFSILSISAISVFQHHNSKKKFMIYYYCGMEYGKEKYIHMIYILYMTLCGLLISIAAYVGIGLYGYIHRIYGLCECGYSIEQAQSWTSLKDYIYISPLSIGLLLILALIINIVSTLVCSGIRRKKS